MSSLQVYTSRISSRDPDRFDITRKSGGKAGSPFAPSWSILMPVISARHQADPHEASERAWSAYVPAFLDEMRRSYIEHRESWEALLDRQRVVLVCYCQNEKRCHRRLLANRILPALGAVDCGEIRAPGGPR